MQTNLDTAAIESLRSFAMRHGEMPFAHLCTAALAGEEWAVERIRNAIDLKYACLSFDDDLVAQDMLKTIRSTDCTRPDGTIARSIKLKTIFDGYEVKRSNFMSVRWQAIRLSDGMVLRGRDGGSFATKALAMKAIDADKRATRP